MNTVMLFFLGLLPMLMIPGSAQDYLDSMSEDPVVSKVYGWPSSLNEHAPGIRKTTILSGSTRALKQLDVFAYEIAAGTSHLGAPLPETEFLVIIKEGELTVRIAGQDLTLGPGSVAVLLPGEALRFQNSGSQPASYFLFQYVSRKGVDMERGRESGGSLYVDWDSLNVRETRKGERRHYFDRPTALLSRFEMHVTTLNEGLRSHPVHTHREEEFLLIIDNDVEEHIDGKEHRASTGDLIFLDAMVPHTITNVGVGPAVYFAFKWE